MENGFKAPNLRYRTFLGIEGSWMASLANIVSRSAPLLGTVIGGPIGAGVGMVVSGIASLFGGDPGNQDDLVERIKADPDAALKLREFELQHTVDLQKVYADNVASARNREIQITATTGKRDWLMVFLAVFITVGFFAMCLIVAFTKMDKTDHDIFYMLLGGIASGFNVILNFYFGSSISVPQSRQIQLPPPGSTQ